MIAKGPLNVAFEGDFSRWAGHRGDRWLPTKCFVQRSAFER